MLPVLVWPAMDGKRLLWFAFVSAGPSTPDAHTHNHSLTGPYDLFRAHISTRRWLSPAHIKQFHITQQSLTIGYISDATRSELFCSCMGCRLRIYRQWCTAGCIGPGQARLFLVTKTHKNVHLKVLYGFQQRENRNEILYSVWSPPTYRSWDKFFFFVLVLLSATIYICTHVYISRAHRWLWLTIAFQLFRDPIFCFIWAELCPIGILRFLISWTLSNAFCSGGRLASVFFSSPFRIELGCLTFLLFFLFFLPFWFSHSIAATFLYKIFSKVSQHKITNRPVGLVGCAVRAVQGPTVSITPHAYWWIFRSRSFYSDCCLAFWNVFDGAVDPARTCAHAHGCLRLRLLFKRNRNTEGEWLIKTCCCLGIPAGMVWRFGWNSWFMEFIVARLPDGRNNRRLRTKRKQTLIVDVIEISGIVD